MPAVDDFANDSTSPPGPCRHAAAVTPDDANDLGHVSRALFIGTAGTGALTVIMQDGTTVAFAGVPAGALLPLCVSRVKSTGTGVSNIVALW